MRIYCAQGREATTHDNFVSNGNQARAVTLLTSAIISSLPDDISTTIITPEMPISPHHILAAVEERFLGTSHADHQALEIHAENIQLTGYENIDDYFKAHETIRNKMAVASYHNI